MNASTPWLLGSLLLLSCSTPFAATAEGEADFGALRMKVARLLPLEPAEVRARIDADQHITACPSDTPEPVWGERAGTALDDVDYLYGDVPTSPDEKYSCLYVVEPLHRALTVDEARDFSAAMMMPDIPHTVSGKSGRAEQAARAKVGEKRFAELRAIVRSGKATALDPETTDHRTHAMGNLGNLEDCSQASIVELDQRLFDGQANHGDMQSLYNATYHWRDLDPDGARCIYMEGPFTRGLTIEEARDFLTALQLDLGYSEEFRRQMQ